MENWTPKKFFLYLLVCSIALSALMGIWAIISGEFGELQARILGTTSTIVGASILGLACGAFLESSRPRGALRAVPILGISLTTIAAVLLLSLIWIEDLWQTGGSLKVLFASIIFAVSFAQLSLLSLARLPARFRWALTGAYVVVLALATITSAIIVFELEGGDGIVIRLIGVLGVVDAALTVMIPIFHRLNRGESFVETVPSTDEIDSEIAELRDRIVRLEMQKEEILKS